MAKIIKNGVEYCGNTDNNVTQTIVTPSGANGYYVLFSNNPTTDTETAGVNKHSNFIYNPFLQRLYSPTVAGDSFVCNTLVVHNAFDISSNITISKNSGNWSVDSYSAYRTGNVVTLYIKFKGNGTAVSAGSNAFQGTVSGIAPVSLSTGCGYISSSAIIGGLWPSGGITFRVTGASVTLSSTNNAEFSITCMVND